MIINIKYDLNTTCRVILEEQLDKLQVPYKITGLGEIDIKGTISSAKYRELDASIKKYGIEIIDNPKNILVQKVKDAIIEMVYLDEKLPKSNTSDYLAEKVNRSYTYLSNVFSEVTYSTIANFIILQKIERAKQMIIEGKKNLAEIAWTLNYSSSSHLSNQFKSTTGLTPTAFLRIIKKRKNQTLNNNSISNQK